MDADELAPLSAGRRWPAPAKINRFLHVLGRRDDGFHELQTEFQFLEWGDDLAIQADRSGELSLHGSPMADPVQDLVWRAASALQQYTGGSLGARIVLHKRVPPGSGLGGGSSDAATALLVLNRLWGCALSIDELARIALTLGADVPVFVRGHAAWAEGVGERLTPSRPPEGWSLLAIPDQSVSTAAVFGHPDLPRDSAAMTPQNACNGRTRNDCEALVRQLCPAVDRALHWLSRYGSPRMSGTGSAVFLNLESRAEATRIRAQAPPDLAIHVVRRCNRSPLHLALEHDPG